MLASMHAGDDLVLLGRLWDMYLRAPVINLDNS